MYMRYVCIWFIYVCACVCIYAGPFTDIRHGSFFFFIPLQNHYIFSIREFAAYIFIYVSMCVCVRVLEYAPMHATFIYIYIYIAMCSRVCVCIFMLVECICVSAPLLAIHQVKCIAHKVLPIN